MNRRRGRSGGPASLGLLFGVSLVLVVSVYALRAAGFRFRWENSAQRLPQSAAVPPSGPRSGPRSTPAASDDHALKRPQNTARGVEQPSSGPRVIDFETYPDGTPACESCPLSDEYRSLGVLFSFRSWSADAGHPSLVDAGSYLPDGAPGAHSVASALQERGLEVGVIRMEFSGSPRRLVFDLTGPDLIDRFQVTAWTAGRRIDSRAILRSRARTFHAVGGGWFRQEVVTIESAAGIERVELDGWGPPGYLMLVDNLDIGESAIPRGEPR